MFSFIASLIIIISSLFMTPATMDAPSVDAPSVESSTIVDWNNPFSILETHVDDLSYGEFVDMAGKCYDVTVTDNDAEWCINLLAYEYPYQGKSFYSVRSMDRGEVTPIENEFFTYYDLNVR